jgi:hypothetical protein
MSHIRSDFIGELLEVQLAVTDFHGTKICKVYKGTLLWHLEDDEGVVHDTRISGSYYIPGGKHRLISPQHWSQMAEGRGCLILGRIGCSLCVVLEAQQEEKNAEDKVGDSRDPRQNTRSQRQHTPSQYFVVDTTLQRQSRIGRGTRPARFEEEFGYETLVSEQEPYVMGEIYS